MSPNTDIGRRLHAALDKLGISPWMPGTLDTNGWRTLSKDVVGQGEVEPFTAYTVQLNLNERMLDLNDPLTAMGVLLLARRALKDDTLFVQRFGETRHWWEAFHTKPFGAGSKCGTGDTEVEALVVTIELAATK